MSDRALGCEDTARCSRALERLPRAGAGWVPKGEWEFVRQEQHEPSVAAGEGCHIHLLRQFLPKVLFRTRHTGICPGPHLPFCFFARICTNSPTHSQSHTRSLAQSQEQTSRCYHHPAPGAQSATDRRSARETRERDETFSERRETQTEQRLWNHSAALPRALLNLQLQGRPKAPGSPTPWGCWRNGGISRVAEGSSGSRSCPPEPVLGPWCTGLV